MGKKYVLFLALSTFSIDKESLSLNENELYLDDGRKTFLGKYHYQMEPILMLYQSVKRKPDTIIVLATDETLRVKDFKVDGLEFHCSEANYFKSLVAARWPETDVRLVNADKDEVQTISNVIQMLRTLNSSNNDGITLTIDIHGGPRATQIMISSIISLLRFEKIAPSEQFTVIFKNGVGVICQADKIYDITRYVAGMNEFFLYARTATLEEYYQDKDNVLIKLIKEISDSIQLCHINRFDEAIKNLTEYIDSYKPQGDYNDLFIESIRSSYGKLMDSRGRNMVVNKVKWCIDNDFIQQALTVIESQMPNELLRRNIILYKYDIPDTKKVTLYQESSTGELKSIEGGIDLMEALDYRKPDWETTINYALIPWIRENCCDKESKPNGRIDYISKNIISGTDKEKYTNFKVPLNCLGEPCIIKNVDKTKNVIKLNFNVNPAFSPKDRQILCRLLMLHIELKNQRNNANHASAKLRASVEEVKVAINAYIDMTNALFESLDRNKNRKALT